MCNPTDNLVQYPLPYKLVDGCLYMEKANKSGTSTRKLCNFLPYLTGEVTVDDGAEQSRVFRIAGIHESGQALPEIEVTVKEFEKTNWVLERWGADCVIEPGNSNKENVCCAILKTSKGSEKRASTAPQAGNLSTANGNIFCRMTESTMSGCSESCVIMKKPRKGWTRICKQCGR